MPAHHHDPIVFTYKTVLMQRLMDWVRVGYRHYTSGQIPAAKAAALVAKFERYYAVSLDRNARSRLKAKGEGSAVLLLWPTAPDSDVLAWWLLVSPGEHPAHKLEKLHDAWSAEGRIEITGYELVRQPRNSTAKPAWTWRMTAKQYEAWRTRIVDACRRSDEKSMTQMLATLYRTPGFAGARSQVGKCAVLLKAEWKRRRGKQPLPALPKLHYVQRVGEQKPARLSAWLRELAVRKKS